MARCLDSVLNNTYHNLEVLCVDDGSTDSSAEIMRSYAAKDCRVVPIFKEHGGVSSARNAGLDQMKGEYVTFVDSDDYVHPEYVELLFRALKEGGTELSICGLQRVTEKTPARMEQISYDPIDLQIKSFSQVFKEGLKTYCCRKMYRADMVSAARFRENLSYGEDTVFFSEVCENAKTEKAAYLPYSLYYYYNRAASLSKVSTLAQFSLVIGVFSDKLLQPDRREEIYLDQTIKRGLNLRYRASHLVYDRVIAGETDALLKQHRKLIRSTRELGISRKTIYLWMIRFPALYRLYRLLKDSSKLKKKIAVKKKRKLQRQLP
ncbi:MAG: glycosyltransferase family 2 protein [Lachnospiraceae bacterium]|nr:glycosyltransferase family 2 protein [Lachnospiraceae bacterium]